jgi:ADP-ribose pyrophosphatase YjhB (NUDIX family)
MDVRFARFGAEKIVFPTPEGGLCIGSFLIIEKKGAVLFGKAVKPEFAKGKWLLPASHLKFGEHPDVAARRIVMEQLSAEANVIKYRGVWGFADLHWDICFVYDVKLDSEPKVLEEAEASKYPPDYFYSSQLFSNLAYLQPQEVKDQLGRGHDEVLRAAGVLTS